MEPPRFGPCRSAGPRWNRRRSAPTAARCAASRLPPTASGSSPRATMPLCAYTNCSRGSAGLGSEPPFETVHARRLHRSGPAAALPRVAARSECGGGRQPAGENGQDRRSAGPLRGRARSGVEAESGRAGPHDPRSDAKQPMGVGRGRPAGVGRSAGCGGAAGVFGQASGRGRAAPRGGRVWPRLFAGGPGPFALAEPISESGHHAGAYARQR